MTGEERGNKRFGFKCRAIGSYAYVNQFRTQTATANNLIYSISLIEVQGSSGKTGGQRTKGHPTGNGVL